MRRAFNIREEPDHVRDRYGRIKWGQCLLLARRLVEVGVRLVHVNWCREPGDSAVDNPMWDTHAQNPDRLEDALCPIFDVGFTALIEDLEQRGMLDETLVVAVGEFGRTPKINDRAGRDHWGAVFSGALAGAGVAGGQVYGASDKNGAYPARDRVSGGDFTATLLHLLGIRHNGVFHDASRREHRLTEGAPIRQLFGSEPVAFERTKSDGDLARVPPFDQSLLLNTDFSADVPLRKPDFGSRPKGWRAGPLITEADGNRFGVALVPSKQENDASVRIALDRSQTELPLTIKQGTQAILAQEMRNPRLGTFTWSVRAHGDADSKAFYEDVFLKNFTCRLVIFRYTESTKNPLKRQEFISVAVRPPFGGRAATFQAAKRLDSAKPGQNFPIGKGFGVAVIVEKTTDGVLTLPAGGDVHHAGIHIESVQLNFNSRTVNDKVQA